MRGLLVVTALPLALFGASCGGSPATGADAVPFQCVKLATAFPASTFRSFQDVYTGQGAGSGIAASQDDFDELAESGPEALRKDLGVLADQHRVYAVMVDEVFEEGEEPDAESLREYDERLAALDTPEHAAAFERVRTWLTKNC